MKRIIRYIIASVLLIAISIFSSVSVFANDENFSVDSTRLYNETNTYNYDENYEANSARYDMSHLNGSIVDETKPLMTVFTHGLGGDASHWSNIKGSFAYTKDSLISRLSRLVPSNVYWVVFSSENTFNIYDITSQIDEGNRTGNEFVIAKKNEIKKITDISKHSIVVFESLKEVAESFNDRVYTEFNYSISKIVYDIKLQNNGKLPRMNLIGHSRGGITNMQYALDHPSLVDSIYSFGTPYTGSTTASIDYHLLDSAFTSGRDGEGDIIDSAVYNKYMNRWNNNYDALYSKINVMALGSYSTIMGFIMQVLDIVGVKVGDFLGIDNKLLCGIGNAILGTFSFLLGSTVQIFIEYIKVFLIEYGFIIDSDKLLNMLENEIKVDDGSHLVSWYNDVLVDLPSQLGYESIGSEPSYKGFKRIAKCYNGFNANLKATSAYGLPAVGHNLEARDVELGNYVLSSISVGNNLFNDYLISPINDNECAIDLYIGDSNEKLLIPEYIGSKKVTVINDYAFASDTYGKEIKSIQLPNTITKIGKNAFYNSENLTDVIIDKDSQLTRIEEGSFSNIKGLKSFTISKNVNYIGENTFTYSNITSFDINNKNYDFKNDLLIDKNVSDKVKEIAIYANPLAKEISIPSNVKILASSLFENNSNIEKVDLNEVEYIGKNAFFSSTLKTIIGGENVNNCGAFAFLNTPFMDSQNNDFVTVGKVLIAYNGKDVNVMVPNGITSISNNCFNSLNIENIILPESIESIGRCAFTGCISLKSILFTSNNAPILDGVISDSNVKYYVKNSSYNYFNNSLYFKDYLEELDTKKFNIRFLDIDGNIIGNKEEEYGSIFDNYIEPKDIIGKDFLYFIDSEGNIFNINSNLLIYEDTTLKPVYENSKYIVNLYDGASNSSYILEYGNKLELEIPYKDGYEFIGFYDMKNGGSLVIDESGIIVWNRTNRIDNLYARYKLINYSISYNTNGGEFIDDILRYEYNAESPLTLDQISELRKFGYVFDCWKYNDIEFVSTYGIYEDIIIDASFKGTVIAYNNSVTTTINHEYAIIDLSNSLGTDSKLEFRISPNVKTATFIGGNRVFTNMNISILNRSGALILGFENIKFYPKKNLTGKGLTAVESLSECDIYINFKGNVEINGGDGKDGESYYDIYSQATSNQSGKTGTNGKDGFDGGYGIRGNKIIFSQYDSFSKIKVKGGNGGAGGRGANGQMGSNGVKTPSGWFWGPKKGDDGANGGTGGKGGAGGNGAYAIYVDANTNLLVEESLNYKFEGGNGGAGGAGGQGGAGGNGASDVSANPFVGVGDPGNGGNGATGGAGGNGGNGSSGTNALNVYGYGGLGGAGGLGNQGGAAGSGGNAGGFGKNGKNGSNGSKGATGKDGLRGIDGYNINGNILGIMNTNYVYNEKFISQVC